MDRQKPRHRRTTQETAERPYSRTHSKDEFFTPNQLAKLREASKELHEDFHSRAEHIDPFTRQRMQYRLGLLQIAIALMGEKV